MRNMIIAALALATALASSAFAQTALHARPQDPFKYLNAKEVGALTEKAGGGPAASFPADHENYMVEFVTRTDTGNVVEIHEHWMHYIHILDGEATLSYGGTVPNSKETSPGEIRGAAIAGGKTVTMHAGDYVQIPAGMPHMFNAPQGGKVHYMVFSTRE